MPTFFPTTVPCVPATIVRATRQDIVSEAVARLRRGRAFVAVARDLREAIAQAEREGKPTSELYELLGCALASRAASVGFATANLPRFRQDRALYERNLAAWQAAQVRDTEKERKDETEAMIAQANKTIEAVANENQSTPEQKTGAQSAMRRILEQVAEDTAFHYGSPKPTPPILMTRDDSKPFLLSEEEGQKEFERLSSEAKTAFERSTAAATSDEERTERQYTETWARLLLLRHRLYPGARQWSSDATASAEQGRLIEAEKLLVLNRFRAFANNSDSVHKARNCRALGDAVLTLCWFRCPNVERSEGIAAYRKAVEAAPRDEAHLRYQLAHVVLEIGKRTDFPTPAQTAEERVSLLRDVCRTEKGNAMPLYQLAAALLDTRLGAPALWQSPIGKEILGIIEAGNNLPFCRPLDYQAGTPRELSAAWNSTLR